MTMYWGPWSTGTDGDGDKMRVGVDITFSAVSHTSTSCTATMKFYTENGTTFGDDKEKMKFSGNFTGSDEHDFTNSGTVDSTYRTTRTYSWTYASTSYGTAPTVLDIRADVVNVYHGMKPYVEVHVNFPARPYAAPAAPTGCGVARSTDEQNRVIWTNRPTAGEPYTGVWLERYIYNYATWARIATLAGTVNAYMDTGAIPNRKYTYRVQADNSVGTSGYSQSGIIFTAPSAPTSPVRTEGVAGVQTITWAAAVGYTEHATEVWRAVDGVYALLATVGSGIKTYVDSTASTAKKNKYKLRTKTTSGTVLYSAYSAETTETTGIPTAPAAPTDLKPATGTINPTGPIAHSWKHNPTDGSVQTFFQVRYRHVGETTWIETGKIASTASTWTMPPNSVSKGNQVEWQVQTWGYSPDLAGAWSASAKWTTTPIVPQKFPLFLDVDSGRTEAMSTVKLISEQTRRVATVARTVSLPNSTAAQNLCTFTLPADLARTGKKFRITGTCSLVPDTAGMYTDLRLYIGVGASTSGTMIGGAYTDHRIVSRAVGQTVTCEYVFDPATAGGENINTINIALVMVPGGGGTAATLGPTRPAFLIIDEIIEGSSTAGGGGGSGVPPGGTTGQVLTKKSNVDGDANWQNSGSGSIRPVVHGAWSQTTVIATASSTLLTVPMSNVVDAPTHPGLVNNSGQVTIPVAGYYQINAAVSFVNLVAGSYRYGYIQKNGVTIERLAATPDDPVPSIKMARLVYFAVGDRVSVGAYQTSGQSLNLEVSNNQTTLDVTLIEIEGGSAAAIAIGERNYSAQRTQAAAIVVPVSTQTKVPWDTVNVDDGIAFSDGVFTVPTAGYYEVSASAIWDSTHTTGYRQIRIMLNGATHSAVNLGASPTNVQTSISKTIKCAAGDTLQINVFSNIATNVVAAGANNFVSIVKVPAPAVAGNAASGVWGVAPLDKYGADSLVGRAVYVDSRGQLRAEPDEDTGWVALTVLPGFAAVAGQIPSVRRIRNRMFVRGAMSSTGITANGSFPVATIPLAFRPVYGFYLPAGTNSGNAGGQWVWGAAADFSSLQLRAGATLSSNYYLDGHSWLTD